MNIKIENLRPEAERLNKLLTKISFETGKDMYELVRQAMIFGIQSATKATSPGKSGTAKGLAKKNKFRPILKFSVKHGYFYELMNGKTFRTEEPLAPWMYAQSAKGNIKRHIEQVIQWWNKKENNWQYSAYTGDSESQKFLRIPHAGAAKVGWYGSLSQLGKSSGGTEDNNSRKLSRAVIRKGTRDAGIAVINMVDYVGKTSPDSARIGLENAEKRLVKTYEKKLQMAIAGTY
jgi:hypothetical protein